MMFGFFVLLYFPRPCFKKKKKKHFFIFCFRELGAHLGSVDNCSPIFGSCFHDSLTSGSSSLFENHRIMKWCPAVCMVQCGEMILGPQLSHTPSCSSLC